MKRKIIFRWLKVALVLYIVIGFAIYFLQDYLLFHPETVAKTDHYKFYLPHKEVNIPFDNNSNLNIIQFTTRDTAPKGVVLYFHGNRKNIEWYAKYATNFTSHQYETWMIDYPGFGKSTGPFTEQRLYDYAISMYKLSRSRFEKENIIIYGKSMGTGIAAQLASITDCRRVILETPYYSMHSLAGYYLFMYPMTSMIHYRLPTFEYLPKIIAPVTIFHGDDDGVIPYGNAEKLKEVMKPKDEFVTIKGGSHNDLNDFELFRQKLDSLLNN